MSCSSWTLPISWSLQSPQQSAAEPQLNLKVTSDVLPASSPDVPLVLATHAVTRLSLLWAEIFLVVDWYASLAPPPLSVNVATCPGLTIDPNEDLWDKVHISIEFLFLFSLQSWIWKTEPFIRSLSWCGAIVKWAGGLNFWLFYNWCTMQWTKEHPSSNGPTNEYFHHQFKSLTLFVLYHT